MSKLQRLLAAGILGKTPSRYIVHDEFTDTTAAGSVNGSAATPGPGQRAVVDTGNRITTDGTNLIIASGGSTSDPFLRYNQLTYRPVGVFARMLSLADNGQIMRFGFDDNATSHNIEYFGLNTSGVLQQGQGSTPSQIGDYAALTAYQFAVVQMPTKGSYLLIKGGAYTNWTLVYVNFNSTAANLYPALNVTNRTTNFDYVSAVDLREVAGWNTDYYLATQRLAGARAANDTLTHTADAILEFTCTTRPSGGNVDFRFRQQDATNYWQVLVDSTGLLTLNEVVAGSATDRGNSAGAVVNGNRVVISAYGSTIRVYSGSVGQTLKVSYTSATNFATATTALLADEGTGGAVTEMIAWPRGILTAGQCQFLDKYGPGAYAHSSAEILAAFASIGATVGISRSGDNYTFKQDLGGGRYCHTDLEYIATNNNAYHIHALGAQTVKDGSGNLLATIQTNGAGTNAWEYALQPQPTGATAAEFVGNLHGYDDETSLTITVDGAPVTLASGESASGVTNVVVTRVSSLRHSETAPTVWGTMTTTYTLTPADGLQVSMSLAFAVDGTMAAGGFTAMQPCANTLNRFTTQGEDQDWDLIADDDSLTPTLASQQECYLWEHTGHYASLYYSPTDPLVIAYCQDRTAGTVNKGYYSHKTWPLAWSALDVWTWTGFYRVAYLNNPQTQIGHNRT